MPLLAVASVSVALSTGPGLGLMSSVSPSHGSSFTPENMSVGSIGSLFVAIEVVCGTGTMFV